MFDFYVLVYIAFERSAIRYILCFLPQFGDYLLTLLKLISNTRSALAGMPEPAGGVAP